MVDIPATIDDVEEALKFGNELLRQVRELQATVKEDMEGPEQIKLLIPLLNAANMIFENITKLIALKYRVGKGGIDYSNVSGMEIPHRGRGRPPRVKPDVPITIS